MINEDIPQELVEAAKKALKHSYSPYSRFPVGAAVLTSSGRLFAAPNIENVSYGLTICAERNAIFHAVSTGERDITTLVLYTSTSEVYTPCGACRQVIAEFFRGEAKIICLSNNDVVKTFTVSALLPDKFTL